MLKSHLHIAWRNLWKTRGYSLLNIFGLGLGIAVASLIFLWIEDEVHYDDFVNKDRVYEVKNLQTYEGKTFVFASNPGPLVPALKEDFPEIQFASRSSWSQRALFQLGDKTIFEAGIYADSDLLEIFSLDFVAGQRSGSLSHPDQVVVSESMAKRFFNRTNIVGETLRIDAETRLTISGVFRDLPANVTVRFDWLRPYDEYYAQNEWLAHWGSNALRCFVQLQPGADLAHVNEKIYDFIPRKSENTSFPSRLRLYPMDRWHLYNVFDADGNEIEGSIKYVRLFSLVAWIILLIACINSMNLSTARSQKRAKEIGVKKVVGASRGELIRQFILESLFLALLAGACAICLAWICLPYFNQLTNKELSLGLGDPRHLLFLFLIIFTTGVVAGSYPAFYLSSLKPAGILKGLTVKDGSAAFVRKGLVILQFAASLTLMVCSLLIHKQIQHAKKKDIGYDRYGLVTTKLYPNVAKNFAAIQQELRSSGLIENVGRSNHHILDLGSNTSDYSWKGKNENEEILITVDEVDSEYLSVIGVPLLAGRYFRNDLQSDSLNVIINRTMAVVMGIENDPIGQIISRSWADFTIVGMVDDFMITDVYSANEPMIFNPLLEKGTMMTMRLKPSTQASIALPQIESIFKQFNPDYPFEYQFVDDQFGQMFRTENLIGDISRIFAIMAIVVSCLGLFGLAAYTAERRTKEIGIRKVLGASTLQITSMLSREFLILVMIACMIAFPVSYWMMDSWLSNYSMYRIDIPIWVFLVSGSVTLLIALLTVSSYAFRVAYANPVHTLRDE